MHIPNGKKRVLLIVSSVGVVLITATVTLSFWSVDSKYEDRLSSNDYKGYSDIDGDGLADWEEILWRTNPEGKDTDGDGTDDGDEILRNRNPWVAGPDDALVDHPAFNSYEDVIGATDSITEKMALRLTTNYKELKDRGIPITPEFKASLVESSLDEVANSLPQMNAYTKDDILISKDSSASAIRSYGTKVANIFVKNSPKGTANEYRIIMIALRDENYSLLEELNPIAEGYKGILDDLLKLPAPEVASRKHVHLINSIEGLQHTINLMALVETDPVVGFTALHEYPKSAERLAKSLEKFDILFTQNSIAYKQTENAYMFSI